MMRMSRVALSNPLSKGRDECRDAKGAGTGSGARPSHLRGTAGYYGVTAPIRTLPLPATVPRALTSWTSPKN